MSLILAMSNSKGIVVTGDNRTEFKYKKIDPNEPDFACHTDFEQKIYMTKKGHVIAFAGNAILDDKTKSSDAIYELIKRINHSKLSIRQELEFVKEKISSRTTNIPIALLIAGIEDGKNIILTTATNSDEISDRSNDPIAVIGVTGAAENIVRILPPRTNEFSLDEIVDYMKFLNATVAQMLEFSYYQPMVSEKCDAIVITPDGSYWKTSLKRLTEVR